MSLAAVRSGDLRHRVVIERATETADKLGDMVPTWAPIATRWAAVWPLNGKELFDAQKVNSNVKHRVTMRDGAGATTSDRFIHNGRTLNIVSVINPEERGVFYEYMCTEETRP